MNMRTDQTGPLHVWKILLCLCIVSCSHLQSTQPFGTAGNTEPEAVPKEENKAADACKAVVTHQTNEAQSRTGIQKQAGFLYVGNYAVPDIFTFIQQKNRAYTFLVNTKKSMRTGYFPTEPVNMKPNEKDITAEELGRGWYLGPGKKQNTPECWIYVQWNGGTAFINPQQISSILESPPFNAIYPMQRENTRYIN